MTLSELARIAMTSRGAHGHAEERVIITVPVLIALYHPGDTVPFATVPVSGYKLQPYEPQHRPEGGELVPERMPEFLLMCVAPEPVEEVAFLGPTKFVETPPEPPFDGSTPVATKILRIREAPLPGSQERSGQATILSGGEWTAPEIPTSKELET